MSVEKGPGGADLASQLLESGVALLDVGNVEDAQHALTESLRCDAKRPDTWYHLAQAFIASNCQEEASKALKSMAACDLSNMQLQNMAVVELLSIGCPEIAHRILGHMIDAVKKDAELSQDQELWDTILANKKDAFEAMGHEWDDIASQVENHVPFTQRVEGEKRKRGESLGEGPESKRAMR